MEPVKLFQYNTLGALMAGLYGGSFTIGELLEHGDLGVGTLDSIDGVLAAEYQKVQDALDIIHKKEEKKQKEASVKQKKEHNILFKIACLCGLIG